MDTTTVRRDKDTIERQTAATNGFIAKMHKHWHEARKIAVCATLKCEHPWAPR